MSKIKNTSLEVLHILAGRGCECLELFCTEF
jgi:hypothetical protein